MDKRYQIFVSSTYADLKEERRRVIQALMEMDCIPSGMELFPAADEEQWEFIKRVIDDCDYYLLIIGGRYGSTTSEGISYTEKEYDYAIEKGLKVIAMLHGNPEEIPMGKSETVPELRGRLAAFRDKVATGRLVKFWKSADELPGLVALSLSKTMKMYPAVGWIRANQASNPQLLVEINELRKDKETLENELSQLRQSQKVSIPNLASLTDKVAITGKDLSSSPPRNRLQRETTWQEIFALIAPHLLERPNDVRVKGVLGKSLFKERSLLSSSVTIDDQVYQTIKVQFRALNLVELQNLKTTTGGMALFWSLTKRGYSLMLSLRTIKSDSPTNT